jgi:outer membrane protein assembly factor BamB
VLWRQGLSEAGDLTPPIVVGNYLIFSGSRAGMFVVDRGNGELLEIFNPGQGVCAAPTVDVANHRLFVLSNSGSLYALNLLPRAAWVAERVRVGELGRASRARTAGPGR